MADKLEQNTVVYGVHSFVGMTEVYKGIVISEPANDDRVLVEWQEPHGKIQSKDYVNTLSTTADGAITAYLERVRYRLQCQASHLEGL